MARSDRLNFSDYAFWVSALRVALLPIGLGGNRPIPFGLAQAGMAISCLFLALSPNVWKDVHFFPRLRWALVILGIVLAWAFFQAQPFVPKGWMHPLWRETAEVLGRSVYGSISVAPENAFSGL